MSWLGLQNITLTHPFYLVIHNKFRRTLFGRIFIHWILCFALHLNNNKCYAQAFWQLPNSRERNGIARQLSNIIWLCVCVCVWSDVFVSFERESRRYFRHQVFVLIFQQFGFLSARFLMSINFRRILEFKENYLRPTCFISDFFQTHMMLKLSIKNAWIEK